MLFAGILTAGMPIGLADVQIECNKLQSTSNAQNWQVSTADLFPGTDSDGGIVAETGANAISRCGRDVLTATRLYDLKNKKLRDRRLENKKPTSHTENSSLSGATRPNDQGPSSRVRVSSKLAVVPKSFGRGSHLLRS